MIIKMNVYIYKNVFVDFPLCVCTYLMNTSIQFYRFYIFISIFCTTYRTLSKSILLIFINTCFTEHV